MTDSDDRTFPLARAFAFLGGLAVAVSTLIAWYDFEVVLANGRLATLFEVPVNLWNYDVLPAVLLLAAGLVTMALAAVPPAAAPRWLGAVPAVIGLGVLIYAVVKCFDLPSLGVPASGHPGVHARTYIDGGPLLAIVGSVMIVLGGLMVLVGVHREARRGAPGASSRVTSPPPAGAAPA